MIRLAGASLALLFAALFASAWWPMPVVRVEEPSPSLLLGRVRAQRVVELHWGTPSGPVVGHAHPGAAVEIEPVDFEHVRVAMPLAWSLDPEERIWVYADHAGFTRSFVEPVPPVFPASSRRLQNVSGAELSVEVQSRDAFAHTACGEVHVLETSNYEDRTRIAQVLGNIVLEGWTSVPAIPNPTACIVTRQVLPRDGRFLLRGGATDADERMVDAIPAGFVTWDRPAEVERRIIPGTIVYLLTQTRSGKGACHEWQFHEDVFARKEPLVYEGKRAYESFGYSLIRTGPLSRRGLTLTGPSYAAKPLGEAVGGYRCGFWYRPVGVTDGVLRVARGVDLSAAAWHPDDEERWYPTRATCDAARAALDAAIAADRNAAPPGGIHRDCFGTWGEKDEDE